MNCCWDSIAWRAPCFIEHWKESPSGRSSWLKRPRSTRPKWKEWVPEGGNTSFAVGRFWGHSRHWSTQHVSQGLLPKDTKGTIKNPAAPKLIGCLSLLPRSRLALPLDAVDCFFSLPVSPLSSGSSTPRRRFPPAPVFFHRLQVPYRVPTPPESHLPTQRHLIGAAYSLSAHHGYGSPVRYSPPSRAWQPCLNRPLTRVFVPSSNATVAGLSSTDTYFTVLEEVSKYNVQLSYVEKLWAVRGLCNPSRNTGTNHEQG